MSTRLRLILTLAVVGAVALAVVSVAASSRRARQLDHVTYSTGFGFFGRDAFIFVCIEKGFCEREGIDVNVVPGNGTLDVAKLIAAGKVDYGIGDFTAMAVARADEGLPVKGIYLVFQRTLAAILSLKKTGIAQPKDLVGKTFADSPASTVKILFPLYAKKAGFDAGKVNFVPSSPPQLPALLASGRVDAVGQFVVGVPVFAKAAGQPIVSLKYAQFFPGLLGSVLMASDDTLASRGDLTRRFLRALDKSLRYSLDNPGDAGRILNKFQPTSDYVVAAQELKLGRPYARTPETIQRGYGYMNPKRVDATLSIVTNGFHPKRPIRRSDVVDSRFLPGRTQNKK